MTKYNLTCEYCGKNTGSLNSVCKECHNKINSDHSSKNCKMDAFKPNRLRPGIFHDAFSRNMSDTPEKCIGCGIMRTKDTLVKHMCPDCYKKDSQEREEFIKKKDWMV